MNLERVSYKGWENCLKLGNGKVELVVTTDVGPRILLFGFAGGQNLFKNYEEQMGRTGGDCRACLVYVVSLLQAIKV